MVNNLPLLQLLKGASLSRVMKGVAGVSFEVLLVVILVLEITLVMEAMIIVLSMIFMVLREVVIELVNTSAVWGVTIVMGRVMEVVKAVIIILEGFSLKMPLVKITEVGKTSTSLLLEVDTHVTCEKCKVSHR